MDIIKQFQHNRHSCWTSIFEWISITHIVYSNPNGKSIYYREASRTRVLYFAVQHVEMILNRVPGQLGLKLTTSFRLVYKSKNESNIWFELLSIVYSNHDTDNSKSSSKMQAHTLYGIEVGRDYRSKCIIFYNPITSSYYRSPDFRLDESILPISNFQVPSALMVDLPGV